MTANPAVPILTYHSLDESGSVISVRPSVFERHMGILRDGGFQGIALGDLLDGWQGRRALPVSPVVLTFDDGFQNVADQAGGLIRMGFRATIFAVAGHCGGTNDWAPGTHEIPRLPLLSWSELRGLGEAGIEIGLHGMTHTALRQLEADVERREIVEAQQVMQDRLGRSVDVFAYPYGVASPSARDLVRRHYRGACSTEMTAARSHDPWEWLGRIDVYYLRHPRLFGLLGTSLGSAYLSLRALGRGARRAVLNGPEREPVGDG